MNNYNSTLVSVSAAATVVLPRNSNRSALLLFNQGSEDINWYFDDNTTITFTLPAGKGMYFPEAPINGINATTAAGSSSLSVMEA